MTDVAQRLDVSASTAHRLLAMLVYRDFAGQTSDRRYFAGPALIASPAPEVPESLVREVGLPYLCRLCDHVGESTNLFIRVGAQLRFVATVETSRSLRVGDSTGRALPLHLASGGRAILATMSSEEIDELYRDSDVDSSSFDTSLAGIRACGYAIKDESLEPEIFAIGTALLTSRTTASAGLSISMPTTRSSPERTAELVPVLLRATAELQAELASRLGFDPADR